MGLFKKGSRTVSWKLNVPQLLEERYKLVASIAGVPVDRLITRILEDWITKNKALLLDESLSVRLKSFTSGESAGKQLK